MCVCVCVSMWVFECVCIHAWAHACGGFPLSLSHSLLNCEEFLPFLYCIYSVSLIPYTMYSDRLCLSTALNSLWFPNTNPFQLHVSNLVSSVSAVYIHTGVCHILKHKPVTMSEIKRTLSQQPSVANNSLVRNWALWASPNPWAGSFLCTTQAGDHRGHDFVSAMAMPHPEDSIPEHSSSPPALRSTCLTLLSTEIRGVFHCRCFLCGCWGSERRLSCWSSKHFTIRAISVVLHALSFLELGCILHLICIFN